MEQEILITEKKMTERKSTKLRELSVLEKEKIYQQHLGLVISIAKRYIGRSPDFTFEDLISEGILGLFKAAEKFDRQKGYRFSTYATFWIRRLIERALNKHGRTIHIPAHITGALSRYKKIRKKLWQELKREPLIEEMAAAMEITIDRARQIRKFLENPPKIISLETSLKGDDSVFSEFIEDERETSPVESASRNILKEDLGKIIKERLTSREEKIIKMRFGLEDGIDHTLQEIAEEMGLSREGIRQIIKKALARLKREKRRLKKDS